MAKKQIEAEPAQAAEADREAARVRRAATGRNDPCPCGSGKKYKKCHLAADEAAAAPPPLAPDAEQLMAGAWQLLEQRRPAAAEKQFRAALAARADLDDARVGIGLARLQADDHEGARAELRAVVDAGEAAAAALRKAGAKDAFSRKEAQPYIRACHALGCLAYDREEYEAALADLERVFTLDQGAVGGEARLVAAKALAKLGRAKEAVPLLEAAGDSAAVGSRIDVSLALALLAAGQRARAETALGRALDANPHYGKALLGGLHRRPDTLGAAPGGSPEEAVAYAQTYGDVWDAPAKEFLREVMDARGARRRSAASPGPHAAG